MTYYSVSKPYEVFLDKNGDPLEDGYIYIGEVNQNPITNSINVYWDVAGLYPAAQPIRTIAGYPSRNGSPSNIFIDSADNLSYSILIQDKNQEFVYSSMDAVSDGYAAAGNVDTLSDLRAVTGFNNPVYVRGHTAVGDGGHGKFEYFSGAVAGTYVDDDGIIIVSNGGDGSGAWIRQFSGNNIKGQWYKAVDGDDITTGLQAALDYLDPLGGGIIDYPQGNFIISADIIIPNTFAPMPGVPNNNDPTYIIRGDGAATTFSAGANNINMFSLPGGAGVRNSSFRLENATIEGASYTGIIGIYLSGPGNYSGVDKVQIRECDTYGIRLEYNGENLDSISYEINQCLISQNGINISAADLNSTNKIYGITIKDSTIQLATGTGTAGIGADFYRTNNIAIFNTVFQSNGVSGGTFGYGYGIKLDQCRHVYSCAKSHFEDHDADSNAYDIVITGDATQESEFIDLRGLSKRISLDYCKNTKLDCSTLYTLTTTSNTFYEIVNRRETDSQEAIPNESQANRYKRLGYDEVNGRVWNELYGRQVDQRSIATPYCMQGEIGNYCGDTHAPASSGAWTATNVTKAAANRIGPHGLQDLSVVDLTATGANGTVTYQNDTTWNGNKVFTVWLKSISGAATARLILRTSSTDVVNGLCNITTDWAPYSVTGYNTGADPVILRIQIPTSGDVTAYWGPTVKDGRQPGPALLNDTNSAITEANSIAFPGGAYFGWEKVGKVWHYSDTWDPASIANGAQAITTITATRAVLGDFIQVSSSLNLQGLVLSGYVSVAGTVAIVLSNLTGAPVDLASMTLYIRVWERV